MKKQHLMLEEKEDVLGICKHYWSIETPNGPSSKGICKICGLSRPFPNSIQEQKMSYKDKMWHAVEERKKRAALKALQEEYSNE